MEDKFLPSNKILIFSLFLLILVAISSASAVEIADDGLNKDINDNDYGLSNYDNSLEDSLDNLNDDEVSLSSVVDADSFEGNNADDEQYLKDEMENDPGNFTELAIEISNAENELKLKKNYTFNSLDSEYLNGITIDKDNFIIDGQGHTINGDDSANIFNISANNVVLKNIIFTHAFSISDGAAVYFNGYGTVQNCSFSYNDAWANGGAVYFNGDGIVQDSNFTYNQATYNGSAVYFNGDGTVENSDFFNNKANQYGGAIYSVGDILLENSNINGNNAFYGGAICIEKMGIINHSNFILNTASFDAGAIIFKSEGKIDYCNFSYNQAGLESKGGAIVFCENGVVNNSIFHYNIALTNAGAINFDKNGTVENSVFTNNIARRAMGAILFRGNGTLKSSNFTNNVANSECGAVKFEGIGNVDSCNFDNNTGTKGGAIVFGAEGFINNSNFTNNTALQTYGGAVSGINYPLTITNSLFLNNKATSGYPAYLNNFTFRFTGSESLFHAVHVQDCTFSNITYWNGSIVNSDDVNPLLNTYPGINFTIEVYDSNNNLVDNRTLMTNADSQVYYDPFQLEDGDYSFKAYHLEDDYYFASYAITPSFSLKRNSSSVEININDNDEFSYNDCNISFDIVNRTGLRVVISDKEGGILINETIDKNYVIVDLILGEYNITVYNLGNENYAPSKDSKLFKINKASATISAMEKTYLINYGGKYGITLKDAKNNPLAGKKIGFTLNGKNIGFATTNDEGVAIISLTAKILKAAKAGKKDLAIKLMDDNYIDALKTVKITINKEKTKIIAKKKSFRYDAKVKKFFITFKDSKNKVLKNRKLSLKVKGKTYKAKTNSKGKAIFKLSKLRKVGTWTAIIKYAGDQCYKSSAKKVKIRLKFRTVSKGTKDKATVRKIQRALKKNSFYTSYKGRYLKIDGKYQGHTVRAVKQFQKTRGLKVTGKVDEKTAKKLKIV